MKNLLPTKNGHQQAGRSTTWWMAFQGTLFRLTPMHGLQSTSSAKWRHQQSLDCSNGLGPDCCFTGQLVHRGLEIHVIWCQIVHTTMPLPLLQFIGYPVFDNGCHGEATRLPCFSSSSWMVPELNSLGRVILGEEDHDAAVLWLIDITKHNLKKHNWQGCTMCYFYCNEESIQHLFLTCPLTMLFVAFYSWWFGSPIPCINHQKIFIKVIRKRSSRMIADAALFTY